MVKVSLMLGWLCAAFCAGAVADEAAKSPMYFPDTPAMHVVAFYEKITGSKVVAERVFGNLYVATGPLTKAQQIEILEEALFTAGYTIIELQPGTIHILGTGKDAAEWKLPIVSKPEDLPAAERVVTYVYTLKSRKADEFAEALHQMFWRPAGGIPAFAADEKQNAVRITARTRVIRNLLKVIGELDRAVEKK